MDYFEKIDAYFTRKRTDEQIKEFEQLVLNDAEFADQVAFYIKTKEMLLDEYYAQQKLQLKIIYDSHKQVKQRKRNLIKIARFTAGACVAIVVSVLSYLWIYKKTSPGYLTDAYINKNWTTLSATAGTVQDSLRVGMQLYNIRKVDEAVDVFEKIRLKHPENSEATQYAGIAYLQLKNYDAALKMFSFLAADHRLQANPGLFYQAIALIKRNYPGDLAQSKMLLKEVVVKKLEGEKESRMWLRYLP